MRMEQDGPSAADLINESSEAELADIFYHYGEERRARAVARAVIEARRRQPFETTKQLADLVASLIWQEPGGIHPATRVFQGLRIAVNDELGELVRALHAAERILNPGGRLVVVTFHSLEDRIVKQFFAARTGRAPAARVICRRTSRPSRPSRRSRAGRSWPSDLEISRNPRARSAKLRAGARTRAPAQEPLERHHHAGRTAADGGETGRAPMKRLLHFIAITALIASAGYAYSIKYETLFYVEQVAKLKSKVQRERDAIAVLQAEWQYLDRPDRLQAAADEHLDLQPMKIQQLARLSDLPNRPSREDEIGRKLEALGLLEPTATPKDKTSDARTPSTQTPKR